MDQIKQDDLSSFEPLPEKKENRFFRFLKEKEEGTLPLLLSFLLPFLIFGISIAALGVYPFGDRQLINYDGWHQYYPFLLQLWDHFHSGTSLLYDWTMGMGTNFLSMLSYYGSSPLNLLLFLVPVREFRVLFTFFVVLRIGLAGYFMGLFLKKVFRKGSWAIPFFSLGYALCGYLMGYFWNNMWLDTVALYPLLCLATIKLFREGKSALYIGVLALSLFSSYYIGFMCCVFTVLVFLILCVLDRVRFSDLVRKFFRFALASLWGAAVAAVLLLPAFFGLLNTASTSGEGSVYVSFYESVRDLIAPLASFHDPAVMDGLPNLATSAILSLFAFAFLWAKKIGLREKLCAFFLLLFLLLSMNFSVLNYFWHGFHFTNMIPYRFAFLFAFAVVVMAWRYYQVGMEEFDYVDAVGMLVFSVLVAFCAFGYYPNVAVLATVAVFALGIILTVLCAVKILPRRVFTTVLCLILTVEMTCSAVLGTRAVGTSSYTDYYDLEVGKQIQSLVQTVKKMEEENPDFYRMECTEWRSLNDSCFYEYPGVSQFASSANRNVSRFLQALGMPADPGSNRFVYVHGTPVADVALGIKYLISKSGHISGEGMEYIQGGRNEATTALYECSYFSGLGFLIPQEGGAFDFQAEAAYPYERQNALFRALTGLEGDLFTTIPAASQEHLNLVCEDRGRGSYSYTAPGLKEGEEAQRVLRFSYTLPRDSSVYIYADVPLANYVQVNNAWHCIEDYPNFFAAGAFSAGSTFTLRAVIDEGSREEFTDRALLQVCIMDQKLWEEGLARLQDGKMKILEQKDTSLKATVKAKEDAYLYTSIPMELDGNWKVTLDGEEVEVTPFAGAFVGLYVPRGEHVLNFTYSPAGYAKGRWISLAAILLLAALVIWEKKGHKLFPEKPIALPVTVPEEEKGEENDAAEAHESDPQGD